MPFIRIIIANIILCFLAGTASPAWAANIAAKAQNHVHKGYYKPGAAVSLTYDYAGNTRPGELENITLRLEHSYHDGYISARLLETRDLQIFSSQTLDDETLSAGSNLHLPIQISGTKIGEHFISLEVSHKDLFGNKSLRVLSLPIYIGDHNLSKTNDAPPQTSKPETKTGFVILEAQEVIR